MAPISRSNCLRAPRVRQLEAQIFELAGGVVAVHARADRSKVAAITSRDLARILAETAMSLRWVGFGSLIGLVTGMPFGASSIP